MTAPLRFEDGALLVLDQRRLPAEEEWLECRSPSQVAEAIRTLAVRGAPAIGLAAAYGLSLAVDEAARCHEEEAIHVDEAARELLATRPTAVDLAHALERGRHAYEDGGGEALRRFATALAAEREDTDTRLAELGAELFAPGDVALTHCNAGPLATGGYGTAGGILRSAFAAGKLSQVYACETRPLRQGARLTMWELGRAGIPCTLIVDSAAGSLLAGGSVDRVVVGADRIARNGDVANKVGTYPLAVLAQRHGVPFVVAAPTSTVDARIASGAEIPIEQREPEEILGAGAPAGAAALNPAFDVTPAELVSAIVTEEGVHEPPYAFGG